MKEKDLHSLKRQDLLELMILQGRDVTRQQIEIETLQATCDRLKAKLNDKDEQIEHLKQKLDQKDERIRELEDGIELKIESGGAQKDTKILIAEIFSVAQSAVDDYIRKQYGIDS